MEYLKHIRKSLGLTQQQMADFLGVERGTVSMAESGKRSLPSKAVIKLAELIKCLPKNKRISKPSEHMKGVLQKQNEEARKKLQTHYEKCLIRIKIFEKKLVKLQEKFNQAQSQVDSIPTIMDKNEKQMKAWIDLMHIEANEKLEMSSKIAQIFLELKFRH